MTLTCMVIINEAVDTRALVDSIWRRGGEVITSDFRRMISNTTDLEMLYQSTLIISPVDSTDSGHFSCEVNVGPDPDSVSILSIRSNFSLAVSIEGKPIYVLTYTTSDIFFFFK